MEHMTLREAEEAYEEARQERIRQHEIERGQHIEGTPWTWYASLHYSDEVWKVLKDREWSRKQAGRG